MKDIIHTKLMLKIAWRDFRTLEGMKEDKKFFADEVFGFHAQQAVEKILKSYLSYKKPMIWKT